MPDFIKKTIVLTVEVPVEVEAEDAESMTQEDWLNEAVSQMVFGSIVNADIVNG